MAAAIVVAAEDGKRERIVGVAGKVMAVQRKLVPAVVDAKFATQLDVDHFELGRAERADGNIWQQVDEGTGASGGWRTTRGRLVAWLRR